MCGRLVQKLNLQTFDRSRRLILSYFSQANYQLTLLQFDFTSEVQPKRRSLCKLFSLQSHVSLQNKNTNKKERNLQSAGRSSTSRWRRWRYSGSLCLVILLAALSRRRLILSRLSPGKNVNGGGTWKQIHLLHHGALMTCRRSFVTHFHLQYECFMSSSGTFAGTMTLTVVFFCFFSDLVWRADDWSAIGSSPEGPNRGCCIESAAKIRFASGLWCLLLSERCLPQIAQFAKQYLHCCRVYDAWLTFCKCSELILKSQGRAK